MSISSADIDAVVLSFKRQFNMQVIVDKLLQFKLFNRIWVLHNYPSKVQVTGVENIYFDTNKGCNVRQEFAATLDVGYVYFQDDDLVPTRSLANVLKEVVDSEIDLCGTREGLILARSEQPYTDGEHISRDFRGRNLIVKGRAHIASAHLLNEVVRHLEPDPFTDDVVLSLTNIYQLGNENYLIRHPYTELSAPHPLSKHPDHYTRRNASVLRFYENAGVKTGVLDKGS